MQVLRNGKKLNNRNMAQEVSYLFAVIVQLISCPWITVHSVQYLLLWIKI